MQNTAKKILIVDSDDAFRESLRKFITGLGHEVLEAATGSEVIDKASSIRPDLIIMDVRLPGTNGDEVTARLKANRSTRNIPVVISTGWTTACNVEDRIARALNAGADEILLQAVSIPDIKGRAAHLFVGLEQNDKSMNEFLGLALITIFFVICYRGV